MKKDYLYIATIIILLFVFISSKQKHKPEPELNAINPKEISINNEDTLHQIKSSTKVDFINGSEAPHIHYVEKNKFVLQLKPHELSEFEVDQLIEFIAEPAPQNGPQLAYHSLKNDTMSLIIETGLKTDTITKQMITTMLDPDTHQVWREYISQYLPDIFDKIHQIDPNSPLKYDIIESLYSATKITQGALAGSALMGIYRLREFDPSPVDFFETAQDLIANPSFDSAAKMGAIQLLADAHQANHTAPKDLHQSMVKAIYTTINDSNSPVTLRMAAINSAFRISNRDIQLLKDFELTLDPTNTDKRLLMVVNNLKKQ